MLTIPQIEALRKTNPQLYETLKRLAGASLGNPDTSMSGEYRGIPFRWILPVIQIVVSVFCFWPSRHVIAWQVRSSMAAYGGEPAPPLRMPAFDAIPRSSGSEHRVFVIDPNLLPPAPTFPFVGPDSRSERWRYWTPLVLNFPAAMLSVPYVATSQDKMEWSPKGMSRWYWRAIAWPTVGLIFWWLAGRGVEYSLRRCVEKSFRLSA